MQRILQPHKTCSRNVVNSANTSITQRPQSNSELRTEVRLELTTFATLVDIRKQTIKPVYNVCFSKTCHITFHALLRYQQKKQLSHVYCKFNCSSGKAKRNFRCGLDIKGQVKGGAYLKNFPGSARNNQNMVVMKINRAQVCLSFFQISSYLFFLFH